MKTALPSAMPWLVLHCSHRMVPGLHGASGGCGNELLDSAQTAWGARSSLGGSGRQGLGHAGVTATQPHCPELPGAPILQVG